MALFLGLMVCEQVGMACQVTPASSQAVFARAPPTLSPLPLPPPSSPFLLPHTSSSTASLFCLTGHQFPAAVSSEACWVLPYSAWPPPGSPESEGWAQPSRSCQGPPGKHWTPWLPGLTSWVSVWSSVAWRGDKPSVGSCQISPC